MLDPLLGVLVVIVLVVALLIYLEVIDVADIFGGLFQLMASAVRLTAGLLFALGAFFVWLVNRRRGEKKS